jgi:starch synthase
MIAMRYGSVPVVSRTGGLVDTVFESRDKTNGFTAAAGDAEDLGRALDRALAAFSGGGWDAVTRCAMTGDFSWERSIGRYLELYQKALRARGAAAR